MRREVWALARVGVSKVSTAVVLIPNRNILKKTSIGMQRARHDQ